MDIEGALASLRAAFPRVGWAVRDLDVDPWFLGRTGQFSFGVHRRDDGWICAPQDMPRDTPVSAVRAWLAAQPTAAFYPKPPSGEAVEVRGVLVQYNSGAYGLAGFSDPECGERSPSQIAHALASGDAKAGGAWVEHPVVIRVPLPVEPPVLVGEVGDV